ncbi:hypothetical protein Tco_0253919 [Tanacetum coccineum]
MIVTSDLFDKIKVDQVEALKEENWKSERITSYISLFEEDNRGIKTRQGIIYIPFQSDVKKLLFEEAHKLKYSIHPGAVKMYLDVTPPKSDGNGIVTLGCNFKAQSTSNRKRL